jgi:hypothetical protein
MDTRRAAKPIPSSVDVANDAEELSTVVQRLLTVVPSAPQAAKTPRRTAVLWVYYAYDGRWCVREEGGKLEAAFTSRDKAAACARAAGHAAGTYRLFLQLKDGRVIEEFFNPANDPEPRAGKIRLPFLH